VGKEGEEDRRKAVVKDHGERGFRQLPAAMGFGLPLHLAGGTYIPLHLGLSPTRLNPQVRSSVAYVVNGCFT